MHRQIIEHVMPDLDHFSAPLSAAHISRAPRIPLWRWAAVLADRYVTPGRAFCAGAVLYLLLCALSFFDVRPTSLLYFADYWEHRAIIAEVARHGTQLVDPIYGEVASSRQFTPWSLALGYLVRWGHVDVDTAMAWGAMTVSLLFVAGVDGFARAFYRHRWAPSVLLAALTCAWGAPPLIWTGFYAFRSQLHGNYYPAALVFALTFVAWGCALRLLKRDVLSTFDCVLLVAAVACSVITHPLNAAFLLAGIAAFTVLEQGVGTGRRVAVALIAGAGIALTMLWPWFNPLSLVGAGFARGQATFNNFSFFFRPLFVISLAWPAIAALLGLPGLIRDRRVRMPLIALALTFVCYILGGIVDISVSHRLLAYVILWLQLLLTRAALDVIDGRPPRLMDGLTPRAWRIVYVSSFLLIVCQIGLAVQQLTTPWANTHYPYPIHPVDAETRVAVAALPPGAHILGWDSAALVMPSHGVKVAVFPRPMPLSPTDAARQADYRDFFAPGTSTCERLTIAHRWHATHIAYLTQELDAPVPSELAAIGPATSPIAPWRIIAVPPPAGTCDHRR